VTLLNAVVTKDATRTKRTGGYGIHPSPIQRCKVAALSGLLLASRLLLIALTVVSCSLVSPKKRILFFGDSVTELGTRPNGYITRIGEDLVEKGSDTRYELVGAGVSGNKIYDLYLRMDEDVIEKNPDVVVIWIGVNDVWHKQLHGTGTDADKFEKFYSAIIKKLQSRHIKVILCTPAVIGEKTDFGNPLDQDLEKYSSIVRSIAKRYQCKLVDLRDVFLAFNRVHNKTNKPSGILTYDRVHLNDEGGRVVATEMLKVLLQ